MGPREGEEGKIEAVEGEMRGRMKKQLEGGSGEEGKARKENGGGGREARGGARVWNRGATGGWWR